MSLNFKAALDDSYETKVCSCDIKQLHYAARLWNTNQTFPNIKLRVDDSDGW
jgi:hypothetical protein